MLIIKNIYKVMNILKCDVCKITIKDHLKGIRLQVNFSNYFHFCLKCGKPVIMFLLKQNSFDEESRESLLKIKDSIGKSKTLKKVGKEENNYRK